MKNYNTYQPTQKPQGGKTPTGRGMLCNDFEGL